MPVKRSITIPEAAEIYERMGFGKIPNNRIRLWAERYGFGVRLGNLWNIDYELWIEFINKGSIGWSKERAMERIAHKSKIALWESQRPKKKH